MSEDPDQTAYSAVRHYALSDLGLHCLPMFHGKDARIIWVKSKSASVHGQKYSLIFKF